MKPPFFAPLSTAHQDCKIAKIEVLEQNMVLNTKNLKNFLSTYFSDLMHISPYALKIV